MAQILLKGIARYPHCFTPSAPPGTDTRRYSIQLLVHKNDPAIQTALAAQQADITATFPAGLPPKADLFITDLSTVAGTDPRLQEYYNVTFSTKEEQGQPTLVDQNYNPLINPNDVQPGDIVWVNGATLAYNVGDKGVKCYFNGLMTTGEKGTIPVELLSSRPTAQQMFAGAGGAPQPSTAAPQPTAPAPQTAPPAAPAPQPAAPAPQYVMTAAAQGYTREQYIAQGWTDEQLIAQGMMQPPGGAPLSFS
jgi:hypothetical protein